MASLANAEAKVFFISTLQFKDMGYLQGGPIFFHPFVLQIYAQRFVRLQ